MPRFSHTADWRIGRPYSHFLADDAARVVGDGSGTQIVLERACSKLFNAMAALGALRLLLAAQDIAAQEADGYLGGVIGELRDRQGGQPSGVDIGIAWGAEAP